MGDSPNKEKNHDDFVALLWH